jgi:hypothetical protein
LTIGFANPRERESIFYKAEREKVDEKINIYRRGCGFSYFDFLGFGWKK